MGELELFNEFNYFANERLDKDDFVNNLREICQCKANEYQEISDRLELLREKLFEKNSYECGDRPKIGY